jgi:hypothetical protein
MTASPATPQTRPTGSTVLNFTPASSLIERKATRNELSVAIERATSVTLPGFLSFESQVELQAHPSPSWSVPSVPTKVLDAPNLSDRIVPSLLDWSSNGTLVVGLPDNVYTLPNAGSQSPGQVTKLPDPYAVSEPGAVHWSPNVSTII